MKGFVALTLPYYMPGSILFAVALFLLNAVESVHDG